MAVDTLSFVSRGMYDVAGTDQSVINARFASWGLVGEFALSRPMGKEIPHHTKWPFMPTHNRSRFRCFLFFLINLALAPIGRL